MAPYFAQFYSECVGSSSVKQRNAVLQCLLRLIHARVQAHQRGEEESLPFAHIKYVVQVMASFPFAKEEEPLFVIHEINRLVSISSRFVLLRLLVYGAAGGHDFDGTVA